MEEKPLKKAELSLASVPNIHLADGFPGEGAIFLPRPHDPAWPVRPFLAAGGGSKVSRSSHFGESL